MGTINVHVWKFKTSQQTFYEDIMGVYPGYILGICSIFYQTEFYLPLGKNKDSPHAKQQWFLLETDQMMDGLVFHVFFTGKNNKM